MNEALAFTILMQASWYVPTTVAGGAFFGLRAPARLKTAAADADTSLP